MENANPTMTWYGITRWRAEDLVAIASGLGFEMTIEEANQWWRENERGFQSCMVGYGNEALETLLANYHDSQSPDIGVDVKDCSSNS